MTIQQCRYILKVAECGSLNEAAKQLFVAQSSLSVSIKSLENELNIKIFERAANGVYLTEEGTEFIRYARQTVEQNDFILNRYAEISLAVIFILQHSITILLPMFSQKCLMPQMNSATNFPCER